MTISDDEAMDIGRRLAREGLLSGVSSGAAVAAALQLGQRPSMEGRRGDSCQLRRALSLDTNVQCCIGTAGAAGWSALSFNSAEHESSLDPYAVLQVASTASQDELKAAYRRLVKQHHPDAGGDEETILALNAAWEQLGDPQSRRALIGKWLSP